MSGSTVSERKLALLRAAAEAPADRPESPARRYSRAMLAQIVAILTGPSAPPPRQV